MYAVGQCGVGQERVGLAFYGLASPCSSVLSEQLLAADYLPSQCPRHCCLWMALFPRSWSLFGFSLLRGWNEIECRFCALVITHPVRSLSCLGWSTTEVTTAEKGGFEKYVVQSELSLNVSVGFRYVAPSWLWGNQPMKVRSRCDHSHNHGRPTSLTRLRFSSVPLRCCFMFSSSTKAPPTLSE